MTSTWRALRRRILTPSMSATQVERRGFHVKNAAARDRLETVGRSFLTGFGYAAESASPSDAELLLEGIPAEFRGFAYEGATMSFAIMDALGLGGGYCVRRFLTGRARRHIYMAHIGIGWAMARVPRWRWSKILPVDPLLGWLALDGFGFHQAYFHTDRYVRRQYQDPDLPWPTGAGATYARRVIDQGIGRALWFVEGTDVERVAIAIDRFAPHRHADLFSGAGLAATYAGGADEDELELFWQRAGDYRPVVAQASAFAAKARVLTGLVTPHTHVATSVFCAATPEQAAEVTDRALADLPPDGPLPAFEVWRSRIAAEFVSPGRR